MKLHRKQTLLPVIFFIAFSVSFSAYSGGAKEKSEKQTAQEKNYAPGEVLVKFKPKTAKRFILALKQELNIKEEIYTESIELYHWKGDFDTNSAIQKLQKSPHVLYAEPNYKVKIQN